jgi:hypothetical protein
MKIASAAQPSAKLRQKADFLQADSRMTRSKKPLNPGLIAIYHFFIWLLRRVFKPLFFSTCHPGRSDLSCEA